MKKWRVDYSSKRRDGVVAEENVIVEAANITVALGKALNEIRNPKMAVPYIKDVVIWGVTIMDDDVFRQKGGNQ